MQRVGFHKASRPLRWPLTILSTLLVLLWITSYFVRLSYSRMTISEDWSWTVQGGSLWTDSGCMFDSRRREALIRTVLNSKSEEHASEPGELKLTWWDIGPSRNYRSIRAWTAWHPWRQVYPGMPGQQVNVVMSNFPFGPYMLLLAALTLWLWRDRFRRPPFGCRYCGFDLRGTLETKCPECGCPYGMQAGSLQPPSPRVDPTDLLGLPGCVVSPVTTKRGSVAVGNECWPALSADGKRVGRGRAVIVRGVNGRVLLVERARSSAHGGGPRNRAKRRVASGG